MKNSTPIKSWSKGGIEIIILLIVIAASLAFVGGFTPHKKFIPPPNNSIVSLMDQNLNTSENSLQLKKLSPVNIVPTTTPTPILSSPSPTPTPTPINECPFDNGIPVTDFTCHCVGWIVECKGNKCVSVINGPAIPRQRESCDIPPGRDHFDDWCANSRIAPTDGSFCLAKPVIYLYPTKTTFVDVKIQVPGKIIESDPLYEGGWKNVEAHPDGSLIYKGHKYHELYYESSVNKVNPPLKGLVIPRNDIEKRLRDLTTKLGLIPFEQKELVDYWLPKLNELNSPYLLISVIDQKEKERIDHVEIAPAPDTKIEFLLYFKPLENLIDIKPLELLEIPKRIGFTEVEWGGTIDFK